MPAKPAPSNVILIAEDDEDDFLFAKDTFGTHCPLAELRWVKDGEELMDFLRRRGRYERAPVPAIILLDLNMPRKDGREALKEIKADATLRRIPVVALTGSGAEEDMIFAHRHGVQSFIRKPVGFAEFVEFMKVCYEFGLEIVRVPRGGGEG